MTLADFIQPVTQAAYLGLLMAAHLANGVPTASWTSPRNTGLSLTQTAAQFFAALRGLLVLTVRGLFLDYASGAPLTLFAKSQYQLERVPAQFTAGIMVVSSVTSAPAYTFAAGDLTIGTPGPQTSNSRFFTNTEGGSLTVGQCYVAGGGQGIIFARKQTGVEIRIVISGLNSPLVIDANGTGGRVDIYQSTDANGNATGTGADIATAIAGDVDANRLLSTTLIGAGTFVLGTMSNYVDSNTYSVINMDFGSLVVAMSATESGAAWNIPSGTPLDMKTSFAGTSAGNPAWLHGTWITSQGADEESDARLLVRCPARWGTLGVGSNEDGFRFWAMAIPNGYTSSPVAQAVVLSGYLSGTYGPGCTVVVIGPNGALAGADVTAVQNNFELPVNSLAGGAVPGLELLGKKYSIGTLVSVVSAANNVIVLTGTVYVRRAANAAIADVQAAVTSAIVAYQRTLAIHQTVYPQKKIAGVIGQAAPYANAIQDVDLSGMADSITSTILQYPLLDTSGLAYQLV